MLTRDQAKKITDRALSFAPTPDCSVSLYSSESSSIRFALNGITTSGFNIAQSLLFRATRGGRTGSISTDEFDDRSLKATAEKAAELAESGLPDPEYVDPPGPQQYADFDNFDDATAAARNKEMIPGIQAVIEGARQKKLIAAGFFTRTASTNTLANKRGLFAFQRSTDARLSATVRTASGSSSGWASQPSVRIAEIDGEKLAAAAIGKCERWANPQRLDPGKYTVVLEPTAASDLVQNMGYSFDARNADQGRSWLSRKGGGTLLGERIFPESITLRNDPFDKRFPPALWTYLGYPAHPVTWIDKGVVRNLSYDPYYSTKVSKPRTDYGGPLILDGSTDMLETLIAGVERGLLVTRFWYIRGVNQQTLESTGITRDGLFLIEKGKVTTPVVNFRFNVSLVEMLKNTERLGTPERVQGGEGSGMIAPAMVVKDFPFTSVSDAI